ncbi:MAG: tyrosine-type recombinase/integrase [Limisphaerales bacterium]
MNAEPLTLSPDELATITELRRLDLSVSRVFEEWRQHRPPALFSRTIGELVPETYAAKVRSGRDPRYCADLRRYLEAFAAFVGPSRMVDTVKAPEIERWFEERGESAVARAANLGRLGALFSYARRQGLLRDHPVNCVERLRVVRREPKILSADKVEELLRFCHANARTLLPIMALQVFTGCRPGEAERLNWENIRLEEGTVVISAEITKIRCRRVAPIHGAGVEWLSLTPAAERKGPVFSWCYSTLRRYRRALATELGIEWCQDILRHTAASALVAVHEDLGKVSRWLGNSPRILQTHYVSLLSKKEGEAILGIRPGGVQ